MSVEPEPLRRNRADVPPESLPFFDAAPALAVHDGPWRHSHRPGLGAALKISGWVVAALVVLAMVLDQLRADPFLDDFNKFAGGFAVPFLALIVLAGSGAFLSHGKVHHLPSGQRLHEFKESYRGTESGAAAVHTALRESDHHPVTWRDISQLTRASSTPFDAEDIVVMAYESKHADYAVATVHLSTKDDEFVIWPPVTISRDLIAGLVKPSSNTTT